MTDLHAILLGAVVGASLATGPVALVIAVAAYLRDPRPDQNAEHPACPCQLSGAEPLPECEIM